MLVSTWKMKFKTFDVSQFHTTYTRHFQSRPLEKMRQRGSEVRSHPQIFLAPRQAGQDTKQAWTSPGAWQGQ